MANITYITSLADKFIKKYGTRDPEKIARELGVIIMECSFAKQKGIYKIIKRNRFIFINNNLDEITRKIVLWHELGHDTLHRAEAAKIGAFQEFNIFNMGKNRMEYEANIFAAQLALSDDDVLECIEMGYDVEQIATTLGSDINLVALKIDTLISQGYLLRKQEHKSDFLKY
jgi:Zn-dependent peptidase ImmA (M78 family)